MYNLKYDTQESELIRASHTEVGVLMRVTDGAWNGHILLHHHSGFVSLTDPKITWDNDLSLVCVLLKPGEKISLTVEEGNKINNRYQSLYKKEH